MSSQQQPRRHAADHEQARPDPIKYGDVFNVHGDLASKPVFPQDAATMQSAENQVLGQTQRGGPAAVMQSAADFNERSGLVGHTDSSDVVRNQGVFVSETVVGGKKVVTETVGGQVVGQYIKPDVPARTPGGVLDQDAITVGEALEAAAISAGDKPVERSDAAAVQAAEVRAIGTNEILPGGVAATAQSAADLNARTVRDEDKTKLSNVLSDATAKLPADKQVTREDAEGVIGAEMRNNPNMTTICGGVAESMAAAARLNQNMK